MIFLLIVAIFNGGTVVATSSTMTAAGITDIVTYGYMYKVGRRDAYFEQNEKEEKETKLKETHK